MTATTSSPASLPDLRRRVTASRRHSAAGLSLIFSLMTLVALSLAAVALIRSVDSGTIILGNLGFKQDSELAADTAARSAITWLGNNIASAALQSDNTSNTGYYARNRTTLDVTGNGTPSASRVIIDWDDNDCAGASTHGECLQPSQLITNANGVEARYVIIRLCDAVGDPTASGSTIACAKPLVASTGDSGERGSLRYPNERSVAVTTITQYFRILVRAKGMRNTKTYTETLVHF